MSSAYENKSLEELQADLLLNEKNTISQINEIKRTEGFITTFKDCIKQQNDVLDKYILERYKLKHEIKRVNSNNDGNSISERRISNSESFNLKNEKSNNDTNSIGEISVSNSESSKLKNEKSLQHCSSPSEFSVAYSEESGPLTHPIRNDLKRKNPDVIKDELKSKKLCDGNEILKSESSEHIKNESIINNCSKSSKESETSESSLIPRRKINRLHYLNNIIYQMVCYHKSIFLGGSRGMLLMVTGDETIALNTETEEDICQMTLFKYNNTVSLVTVTRNYLILFIDVLKQQCPEKHKLSNCGLIYNDKNEIYIPIKGSEIKKFVKHNCSIESHIEHSHDSVRLFLPCKGGDKERALIILKDKKLYKTWKNDFDILEVVEGVKNVKNLLRFKNNYVCCSKRKLWVLNSETSIVETVKLKADIKFITSENDILVILSGNNLLEVYQVREEDTIKKLHEQQFQLSISALCLHKLKIYLVISDEIVTLKVTK